MSFSTYFTRNLRFSSVDSGLNNRSELCKVKL